MLSTCPISLLFISSSYSSNTSTVAKCKRVFQSIVHIAVQELCKAANAIVLPVTLGVVKPTSSFSPISTNSLDVSVNKLLSKDLLKWTMVWAFLWKLFCCEHMAPPLTFLPLVVFEGPRQCTLLEMIIPSSMVYDNVPVAYFFVNSEHSTVNYSLILKVG